MDLGRQLLKSSVEIVSGAALVVGGVIVQVRGAAQGPGVTADLPLLITGGMLVVLGGVLLSWVASKALAERQAVEAAETAREEVDAKLDSLSRALGQSAGQISQAVEQSSLQEIPASTGFALVAQATRMIYGQVNEIAVIRGTEFDSAYLLQTVSKLDDLARELSAPGSTPEDDDGIAEVRRQLNEMRASLSRASAGVVQRGYALATCACPACGGRNTGKLGTVPGDTAQTTCSTCATPFNIHRNAAGEAFTRPIGPLASIGVAPMRGDVDVYWEFDCDQCGKGLRAKADGRKRVMACTSCFAYLRVDASLKLATSEGNFDKVDVETVGISGGRPKFHCPQCGGTVKSALQSDSGWMGLCVNDRKALVVAYERFSALLEQQQTESAQPTGD